MFGAEHRLERLEEAVRALIRVVERQNELIHELVRELKPHQRASSGAIVRTLKG